MRSNSSQTATILTPIPCFFEDKRYGLSGKKLENIAMGSLLHDVGFSVLSIHNGDFSYNMLSNKELHDIKMHVITGFELVEKETWLSKKKFNSYYNELCIGNQSLSLLIYNIIN